MLKRAGLVGIDAVAAVGATAIPPQEDIGVVEVLVEVGVQEDTILGLILARGLVLGLAHARGLSRLPTLPGKGFGLLRNLTASSASGLIQITAISGLRTVQDAD